MEKRVKIESFSDEFLEWIPQACAKILAPKAPEKNFEGSWN
jgi:hypothetical protein